MKKKALSMLLAVVMLVSTFTVGFGSIAANARQSGVGGGAESFNPVIFTQSSEDVGDTTVNTSLCVKITDSNYKVKINSVSAVLPFYEDGQTAQLNVDYSAGTVVSDEKSFAVTGEIAEQTNSVVRYTVGYDILDKEDNTVWKNLTGYGYGIVAGKEAQTGEIGTVNESLPGKFDSGANFSSLDKLNSCYVQVAEKTLKYSVKTQNILVNWSSRSTVVGVTEGTAPTSLSTGKISWPTTNWWENTADGTWLSWTEPDSGYYNFTVDLNSGDATWDEETNTVFSTEMYYLKASDKETALSYAEAPLGLNGKFSEGYYVQKGKYTEESWSKFLSALDMAYQVAYAVEGASYGYKLACTNGSSAAEKLLSAFTNLEEAPCDWTTYKDAEISTKPTCSGAGAKTYYCICGKTKTESVSSAGCKPSSEWIQTVKPTCTTEGEEVQYCTVCKNPVNVRTVDALGHDESKTWSEKTAPTCTNAGEEIKVCTRCGIELDSRAIKENGHDYTKEVTAPTCVDKGYTTYTCKQGDHTYIADYVDAKGHTAGKVEIKDATAVSDGLKTVYCKDCGEVISTETISRLAGKVVISAQSNGKTIATGVVSSDYSVKITVPKGSVVDAGEVTGSIAMTDIASLGIEGTRTYEKTITTGVEKKVPLDNYLPDFESAVVKGTVDGKAYAYNVTGTNSADSYTIDAVAQDEDAVRSAYKALSDRVTTQTKAEDDSYAIIPGTAYIQIGKEKLSFENTSDTLKLDNIVQGSGIKAEIKSAVKLEETEELENAQIEVFLPAGTVLAVGQSVATLNDDARIMLYGYRDSADVNTILSMLRDCQTNEEIIKTVVLFISDFAAAINGQELTANIEFEHIADTEWVCVKEPTATKPGKEVRYCTICGEVAEEREIAPLGVTVSGTVKSFATDSDESTTIELIADGKTVYTTSVAGTGEQDYSIEGVLSGTYTVRVSKLNHVTREYEITVDGADVEKDLAINLKGDVSGDGKITVTDYVKVLQHAKGMSKLEGYDFKCGDVDENNKITVTDYVRILQHAKGVEYLW